METTQQKVVDRPVGPPVPVEIGTAAATPVAAQSPEAVQPPQARQQAAPAQKPQPDNAKGGGGVGGWFKQQTSRPEQPQRPVEPPPVRKPQPKYYQNTGSGMGFLWGMFAHGGSTVGAIALWWLGGQFTVKAICNWQHLSPEKMQIWGLALWLIPVFISAVEQANLPQFSIKWWQYHIKADKMRLVLWGTFTFVDIFTTFVGIAPWIKAQDMSAIGGPNFTTIDGGTLFLISLVISVAMAFMPEWIAERFGGEFISLFK